MMRTIKSQTYTNVALTVLIVLMTAMVLKPYFSAPKAQADGVESVLGNTKIRNAQQNSRAGDVNSQELNAAATEKVAAANERIASALQESARNQGRIADAITRLATSTSK
jgi:hypothetical protein